MRIRKTDKMLGLESYERQDRSGLLARMLLESPIWFNPVVKLTWKRKVIKMKKITRKRYLSKNISSIPSATILNVKDIPSNRSLFQLAVSERHINGIGYDGGSKDMINRKRLIGNTYQIYRSILHQLAIDENWNNVYSDITLPSGDMGTIKVERIDDEKKDEDV